MTDLAKNWKGTFEIWQNPSFAAIYSKNNRQQLRDVFDFFVFISKKPLLGATALYAYCLPDDPKKLAAVESLARRLGAARIIIYSKDPISPRQNYFKEISLTLVVDLSPEIAGVWDNIGKKTRNMVRKGRNCDIEVRRAVTDDDFDRWWEIYRRLCAEKKFGCQNYGLARQLFESPDISRLFVSAKDGKIIGGSFFLVGSYPMYWLGAFDKNYSCGHINIWTAIASFKNNNFPLIDLGGIGADNNEGTTIFKKQFSQNVQKGYIYEIPVNLVKYRIVKALALIQKLIK